MITQSLLQPQSFHLTFLSQNTPQSTFPPTLLSFHITDPTPRNRTPRSEPKGSAQVIVTVDTSPPQGTAVTAPQSISRTVFVKGGQTFICQMLGLPGDHAPFFIGGRTHWDSVLEELLGEEASVFRSSKEDSRCSQNPGESDHVGNQPLHRPEILECLAEMIVATACYALRSSPLYTKRADCYESLITNVPELRHLKMMLEATDNRLLDKLEYDRTVSQIYMLAEYQLGIHCRCPKHALFSRFRYALSGSTALQGTRNFSCCWRIFVNVLSWKRLSFPVWLVFGSYSGCFNRTSLA